MKKFYKRFSKTRTFRLMVCWLIMVYVRLVYYTSRKTMIMDKAAEPYARGELPAVYAFWHGRLLMMAMLCPPGRKMNILISSHGDGEIIAQAMHYFGFGTIRGSTTRGGSEAAIKTVKALQAGENIVITPDGPRGPAMQLQPGILSIAEMAKLPIITATFSASPHKRMKSWDSFMLAMPFGRICYHVSEPMFNPTKEELEKKMIEIVQIADKRVMEI